MCSIVVNTAKNTSVNSMNVINKIIVINQKEPRNKSKNGQEFVQRDI